MIRRGFGVGFYQQGANQVSAAVRGVDAALRGAAGAHGQVAGAASRSKAATDQAAAGQRSFGNETKRSSDEQKHFAESARASRRSLADLYGGFALVKEGAMLAGKALAAVKVPANLATSFEYEVAKIRTLGAQLPADLEQQLLDLAARVPQTAGDITRAAYDAISAGIDPGQVADFLDSASKVAVAGSASMTEAVNALAASTNAFKDSGLTAAQAADQLFGAVRGGVTTFDQLAANQGKSLTTAAQLGVSYAELNAAVAQLTKVGVPTSEAYTRVNATLKALGKELGVGVVQSKGLVGSLEELQARGLTSADAISKMTQRQEAQQGLMVLLKNGMADYRATLEGVEGAVGSTGEAFEAMSNTTQGELDKLKAAWDTTLTEVGRQLLPEMRTAIQDLGATLSGPDGQQIIKGLAEIAKIAVDAASAVGQFTGAVAKFYGNLQARKKANERELFRIYGDDEQRAAANEALQNVLSFNEALGQMRQIGFGMQLSTEVDAMAASVAPKLDQLTTKASNLWATLWGQAPSTAGAGRSPQRRRRGSGRPSRSRQQQMDAEADAALAQMDLEYQAMEAELAGAQAAKRGAGDEPGGPLQIAQSYEALGMAISQGMDMGAQAVGRFSAAWEAAGVAAQAIEATSRFTEFGAALGEQMVASTLHALLFGNSIQQAIGSVLKMASVEAAVGSLRALAKAYEAAGTPFMQWAVGPLLSSAAKWAALSVVAGAAGAAIGGTGGGGSRGASGGSPSSGRPSPAAVGQSTGGGGGTTYVVNNTFTGRTFATQAQIGAEIDQATRERGRQRGGRQVSRYAERTGRA